MEFKDIHLLRQEKISLFTFHFRPAQRKAEIKCFQSLYNEYHFIKRNLFGKYNECGIDIGDGTYSISDQYRRFKIYRREIRMQSLPNWIAIVISILTLLLNVLIELWRLGWLSAWLQ